MALGGTALLAGTAAAQPTWRSDMLAGSMARVNTSPTLAEGPRGAPWAAWLNEETQTLHVSRHDGTAWLPISTFSATDAGMGRLVGDLELVVTADRTLVAFRAAGDGSLSATRSVGVASLTAMGWSFEIVWSGTDAQADGLSLTLDPMGEPHLAFVVTTGIGPARTHELFEAARGANTWTLNSAWMSSGATAVVAAPDLAIDPRGGHMAVMIHNTAAAQDTLVYLNNNGGGWDPEPVDSDSDPGEPSALDILADGSIQITYRVRGAGGVRRATRSNGSWAVEPVDGAGKGRGLVTSRSGDLTISAWLDDADRSLIASTSGLPDLGVETLDTGVTPHLAVLATASSRLVVLDQRRRGESTELVAWTADLNGPPDALPDGLAILTTEDVPGTLSITPTDPEGDAITVSIGTSPMAGTLEVTDNGDGTTTLTYTPAPNTSGEDSFTVVLTDAWGHAVEALIPVTVTEVNDPPTIAQGGSVDVTLSEDGAPIPFGLMLSATDPEDGPMGLSWSVAGLPTHGTVSVEGNGTEAVVTYVPDADYAGEDTFTVQVTDAGGASSEVVVHVTILPTNDPPAIGGDATVSVTMSEDGAPTPFALTLTSTDPDQDDVFTWSIVADPAQGTASVEGTGRDVAVSYTPEANASGEFRFTVRLTDAAGGTDEVEVIVTIEAVNDAPTAALLDNAEVAENLPAGTLVGTLASTDLEGGGLSFTLVDGEGGEDNALFTLSGAQLLTAERLDHEAADLRSIRVQVADPEGATTQAALEITVLDRNDPIVAIMLDPDHITGEEAADVEVSTLSALDQDELDVHTFNLVAGDGDDDNAAFTINGDRLLTAVALTDPTRQFYQLRVEASDGQTTLAAPLELAVQPLPIANDDQYNVRAGRSLTIDAPGLLANDTPGGDGPLTATLRDDVTHGSLAFAADGSFTYAPAGAFIGDDQFTYVAEEDGAPSNVATVILNVRRQTDMDAGTDIDPDADPDATDMDAGDPDTGDMDADDVSPDVPDNNGTNNATNNGGTNNATNNNGGNNGGGNNDDGNNAANNGTNNGTNGGSGGTSDGNSCGCTTPARSTTPAPLGLLVGLLGLVGLSLWRRRRSAT